MALLNLSSSPYRSSWRFCTRGTRPVPDCALAYARAGKKNGQGLRHPKRNTTIAGLSYCRKRERGTRLGRPRARSLTRLFPRPPTEPCGTVSVLHGSPVGTIHRFRMTGITPPYPAIVLHLWPFAMWLAFPAPDYYDHSVTLGLSPRRPSRSSLLQHVLA